MSTKNVQFAARIDLDPASVIDFVADIRNRTKYLDSLKSVSDIEGDPGAVTKSWHWKWELLGHEFEGTGNTVDYESGRRYSFITEGGISSKFTYRAEPAEEGTQLRIDVEFEIPAELAVRDDLAQLLTSVRQRGDQAVQRLKEMMETSST